MGGNEITAMASTHPDRVASILYLDGAYDWSDFGAAFKAFPPVYLNPPARAMASLDTWRAYQRTYWFPEINDLSRVEAYNRELVVLSPEGKVRSVMSDSASEGLIATLLSYHRDYAKIHSPALAIYAETMLDIRKGDSAQVAMNLGWERKYMAPFRAASIERVRHELPNVEIVNVLGTHMDFVFTSREKVVDAIRKFLSRQMP